AIPATRCDPCSPRKKIEKQGGGRSAINSTISSINSNAIRPPAACTGWPSRHSHRSFARPRCCKAAPSLPTNMIWPRIPTSTRREGQVLIARDLVRGWYADQLHGQCRTGPADVGAGYRNGSVHKSRALTAVKPGPAIGRDDHLGAGIKIHLCLI